MRYQCLAWGIGALLALPVAPALGQTSGSNSAQEAEIRMLRSSAERLGKENAELKKQVADLKKKLEEKPAPVVAVKWVMVFDSGESMQARFDVAKKQMRSAVQALPESQSVNVVVATVEQPRALRGAPVPARSENKTAAVGMIEAQKAGGKTRLLPAIQFALDQRPDVVHLITDGNAEVKPAELAEAVKRMNADVKAKIHTSIACCSAEQVEQMKALWRIARDSGGNCTDDRGVVIVEEPKGNSALFR